MPPSFSNTNLTIMEKLLVSSVGELNSNHGVGSLQQLPVDQTDNKLKPCNCISVITGLVVFLDTFHFTKAVKTVLFSNPAVIAQGKINHNPTQQNPRNFSMEIMVLLLGYCHCLFGVRVLLPLLQVSVFSWICWIQVTFQS